MHLIVKLLIPIIIGSMIFCINAAKKPGKKFYFISTHVEFNPIYITEHKLDIVTNNTLDVILNLPEDYQYDPWSNIVMASKKRKLEEYRVLLQYDVNICTILGKGSAAYISLWIQNFLKYGNLPKTCPILKGNYSWHDLKVDKLSVPDFLPTSLYRATIDTYFRIGRKRESVANLTIFMELK
ncbi:uncharacterized protein LOC142235293 [Haematobia irritans]|uniref:uncharacterized protein LOC142235293 n=1 Tax=Haematobia irritans TaxID=7368 RepID=UPI003F508DFA